MDKLKSYEEQLYQVESMLHDRLNEKVKSLEATIDLKVKKEQSGPQINEVVKQITMLAGSLSKFENENVRKIDASL